MKPEPVTPLAPLDVKHFADAAGRDIATLQTTVFRAPKDEAGLAAYRRAGVQRVLLEVPDASRDDILRTLDENAHLTH